MARVTGPLMSMSASGSLANSIVFSNWRGTAYVRGHAIPSNPQSTAQRYTRAMMAFLASQWATIDPSDQATWENYESGDSLPNFNRYVRYNMNRWKQALAPSQYYPSDQGSTTATASGSAATGQVGQVIGAVTINSLGNNWGIAISIGPEPGGSPVIGQTAVVIAGLSAAQHDFTIRNLAPGAYTVAYQFLSVGGAKGAVTEIDDVTVT